MPVLFCLSEGKDESQSKRAHGDILRALWSGDAPFDLSISLFISHQKGSTEIIWGVYVNQS